jgi:HSP20 family protein
LALARGAAACARYSMHSERTPRAPVAVSWRFRRCALARRSLAACAMRTEDQQKPGLLDRLRDQLRRRMKATTPAESGDLLRDMFRSRDVWDPTFEVRENGTAIKLLADLPGVKPDDLEITLQANVLTIAGKREAERKLVEEQFHAYERAFGQFVRSFTLPEYVDLERIASSLEDGVLTIVVPKTGESKSRRIKIGESRA